MEFKDIVSISGMSGLYEVITRRADGMIVRGLDDGKPQFISSRIHVFTPLDAITIYTTDDNTELSRVLLEVKKQVAENPPVDLNADNEKFKSWFKKILPDYHEEKVYVSDIKKLIKWYQQLDKHHLITEEILAPPKKEKAKSDEHGKEMKEKPPAEKPHKPAAQPKAAANPHSKAASKRTGIGAKKV
ncbi:MAG TPA: DUF5606 domain-containing protein [Chitinophagales bacterium]|nr:DUF5606 domain-containing protein [Chitinophagales bacterium]